MMKAENTQKNSKQANNWDIWYIIVRNLNYIWLVWRKQVNQTTDTEEKENQIENRTQIFYFNKKS